MPERILVDPFVVALVYVPLTLSNVSRTPFFLHCCTSRRHFHCSYTPIVLGVEVCAPFLPSKVPRMQLLAATARLRMARIILQMTTTMLVDVDAKDGNLPSLPMRVASTATTSLFRLAAPCPCVSLSFFLSSLVGHASGAFLSWYLPWWSMQVVHFSLGTFLGGPCKWCISFLVPSLVGHASGAFLSWYLP